MISQFVIPLISQTKTLCGTVVWFLFSLHLKQKVIQHGQEKNYALDQKANFHFHVVQPGS